MISQWCTVLRSLPLLWAGLALCVISQNKESSSTLECHWDDSTHHHLLKISPFNRETRSRRCMLWNIWKMKSITCLCWVLEWIVSGFPSNLQSRSYTFIANKPKMGWNIWHQKEKHNSLYVSRFIWDVAGVWIWTHEIRNISISHSLNQVLKIKYLNLHWNPEWNDAPFEGMLSLNYSENWVLN